MSDLSITMRHYYGESDLQKIVDLFDACEKVDKLELSVSTDRLRLELADPTIDLARGLSLWEDPNGQLMGFGELSIDEPNPGNPADGTLWFVVHPIARGGDLDRQIIEWAEARMKEVGRERQGQLKLFTWSRDSRKERMATLHDRGFTENRYFWFLTQPLTPEIPKPQLPAGFTIRTVDAEREAQAWVDLHNRCFINTWNYHPLTVESYRIRLEDPEYLPELNLVAIDREGKFAAICYCAIYREHNLFIGRQEGWVALLFTSPDFRQQGLAKAMLLHGLARLKALNMSIAKIGVDSENPFGARKLYESVGFDRLYTNIAYVKHLSL
jgi:mycothiol synthase